MIIRWRIRQYVLALLASGLISHAVLGAEAVVNQTIKVTPRASDSFKWPYYLYIPWGKPHSSSKSHRLLVLPNNTGRSDDDYGVHDLDARRKMERGIADDLGVVTLKPVFPRPKTRSDVSYYTHALDRDTLLAQDPMLRRLDEQLLAMVDDAIVRLTKRGFKMESKFLISGFSAAGMFTNRMVFLHPNRIRAAAIGSPGGWPMFPVESWTGKTLRYPIGVGDLQSVTGIKFDLKSFKQVPMYFYLGDLDENDSVPFDDGYDVQDKDLIFALFGETPVKRWSTVEKAYKDFGALSEFKLYPGVGHETPPSVRDDVIAFLRRHAM